MKKKNDKPAFNRVESEAVAPDKNTLIVDPKRMIEEARSAVAVAVNAGLTLLYWRVGKRINTEILKGNRAEYGNEFLPLCRNN